jgi:hypothetical protein
VSYPQLLSSHNSTLYVGRSLRILLDPLAEVASPPCSSLASERSHNKHRLDLFLPRESVSCECTLCNVRHRSVAVMHAAGGSVLASHSPRAPPGVICTWRYALLCCTRYATFVGATCTLNCFCLRIHYHPKSQCALLLGGWQRGDKRACNFYLSGRDVNLPM